MKIAAFLSVCLLVFSLPVLAETSAVPRPGEENYQRAMIAIQNGTLDEAEQELKEAILEDPRNPQYHFELANLYALAHDESEQAGDEYGATQRMRQAARELEQAVMASPGFLPGHYNLGVVYKKLGKYEAARREFKIVLQLDPNQTGALLQLGRTYSEQGFYDDAESIYQEILDRDPSNQEARQAMYELSQFRQQDRINQRRPGLGMDLLSGRMAPTNASYGSPYTSSYAGQDYNQNYNSQQQGGGMQQGIAYLGQMALQQLFKGNSGPQASSDDQS